MIVCVCLKAVCMILFKWWSVCVSMRFIWYYLNEKFICVWIRFIWNIKMSVSMCLKSLCMILFKWWPVCFSCALYDIIELRDLCVWIGFIWNIKMRVCMCLKALCMILFKWWPVCVSKRFIWYYWNERLMCLDWFYMKY